MFFPLFYYCYNLTSIPENLFANNPEITDIGYIFTTCQKVNSVPSNLFENNKKINNFSGSFSGCTNITGITPVGSDNLELWERVGQPGYPASITSSYCFRGCNFTNQSSIPSNWR